MTFNRKHTLMDRRGPQEFPRKLPLFVGRVGLLILASVLLA